jgi:tight adherence protein C
VIAYNLLTTLFMLVAVVILVYHLGVWVVALDARGRQILKEARMSPGVEIKEASLLARASRFGVGFLTAIKEWEQTNRFGMAARIATLERQLIKAGLRSRLLPEQMIGAALVSALFFGAFMGLAAIAVGFGLLGALFLGLPVGAVIGFLLPKLLLDNLVANRMSLIEKRLPFASEFMLLTMEANAAFPSAIEVYCEQMPDDPLAEEFRVVLLDIESGLGLQQAMLNLGERIESDSLSGFILAITTGIETGQPIKDVLEVQADVTRQRRYSSAEQVAKTASTRAIFPLFVVMLAALLLLLGPMLIKAVRTSLF